ncbi:MAG: hypothetical protein RL673_352, partial [Actinomycetota bacterium]
IRSDDAAKVALGIEQAFEKRGFSSPRFFDSLPGDGARVESY